MKILQNYTKFKLYENLFAWINDKVIKGLKGWSREFLTAVKAGLIRTIPSGPRKGKPFAMLFVPQNGSITKQVKDFYYSNVTEAVVPLDYPTKDIVNQSAEQLRQDIMDYYKIKNLIANGEKGLKCKPLFIYGAPGIGKTEIVTACADELSIPLIFLDCQFMNPEDFKGVPSLHEVTPMTKDENGVLTSVGSGYTRANPPSVFPRDNGVDDKGGILFLDELNRSNESVLGSLMQFIQAGRIGDEYSLPSKWIIVAAGNRQEDDPNSPIQPLGTALTGRFTPSNYVPDFEEWAKWASSQMNIMPELVMFLRHNAEFFHYNDPEIPGAYPTPRSWTQASQILLSKAKLNGKVNWRELSSSYIVNVFAKEIGPAVAGKFNEYLDVLRDVTDDDINLMFKDPMAAPIPGKIKTDGSLLYGLMAMVLARIKTYKLNELFNMFIYFDRYKKDEQLAWLFNTIRAKYPDFTFLKEVATDTPAEKEMKLKVGKIITGNQKLRGLI